MPAYITVAQIKQYLDQLSSVVTHDTVLGLIADRATAFVNEYLGVTTNLTAAASATRVLYGDGGLFLSTDIPIASVTVGGVTAPSGYTVPTWALLNGVLRIVDTLGVVVQPRYRSLDATWLYSYGWGVGVPYTVVGTFGYSADDLAVVTEACLQTAVQLWRYKDSGGSETIGAEGAITTVKAGWTPLVKGGLDAIRRKTRGNAVGVW